MGWTLYFWAITAWLVIPVPFKIAGYITGKDKSPASAKVEEAFNTLFFLAGLVGLYGYVYDVSLLTPLVWKTWTVVAVAISLAGLIWTSPKLKYGIGVMGMARLRIVVGFSFIVMAPMLLGVWRSGA